MGGTTAALAGNTVCKVIAYKGSTQVSATIGAISGMPTGMTASIANNSSTNAQFTVAVTTAMTTKNGMLTIPITVDGKSFSKNFSFALALKGDIGGQGPQGDPMGILELATEPPTKYTGMLWKHTGTVNGLIKNATYRWTGSAWVLFKFRADNIEADSFTGYEFNGSIFKSDFDSMVTSSRRKGNITINDGNLVYSYENYVRESTSSPWTLSTSGNVVIGAQDGIRFEELEAGKANPVTALLTAPSIKDMYTTISNLSNRLDWTLIQTNIPATTTTQFPNDKKEILVGIIYGYNGNTYLLSKVFHQGYDFGGNGYVFHLLGGAQVGTNTAGSYIAIKPESVYIDSVYHTQQNVKSSAKYFVAYR